MATVRKSVFLSSLNQYYVIALAFLRLIILSRILTSEEFGIYIIAMSFLTFARVFRIFGIWDYIISDKELTEEKLGVCFTIVGLISLFFAVLFFSSSGFIGRLYGSGELETILNIVTISFLLNPFGLISQALMQRNMEFGKIFFIQFVSSTTNFVLSVALALLGYGAYSVAWGFVSGSAVMIGSILYMDPAHIVFRPRLRNSKEIMKFGGLSTFGDFLWEFLKFAPSIVAGLTLSLGEVGVFSRGQALINFFRQGTETAIGLVSKSWFAATSRENPLQLKENYLKATVMMSVISWPAFLTLFFLAPQLIRLVLGDGWERSVPVTQILSVGGLFSIHVFLGLHLFTAIQEVRWRVMANFVAAATLFIALLSFSAYGIRVVALSITVSQIMLFCMTLYGLHKLIGLNPVEIFSSALPSVGVTLVTMLPLVFLKTTGWIAANSTLVVLAVSGILTALFWIGSLWLFRHPLRLELMRAFAYFLRRFKGRHAVDK